MKLRKFLTLFLLSTGAFFVLSNQTVKADTPCVIQYSDCTAACATAFSTFGNPHFLNYGEYQRCVASCLTSELACYSYNGWQNWLQQVNLNIGDNFLILNEPNPMCAYYPDQLVSCGSLPTAEEIEACMLMVQQEQARDHCP